MSDNKPLLQEPLPPLQTENRNPAKRADELCNRIDRIDPEIRAFVPETDRRGRLGTAIGSLKEQYSKFENQPPLYGVPIGVKDIIHVDGLPTRAGTDVPPDCFGGSEAEVITEFRQAGAIVLGKTVTTEFALSAPGPTRNPHNTNHTPGGSSSGSAAAVAAGICPLAIGTQTNGSVIRPASFCGVVGFKPSFGRIPMEGVITVSPSTDHLGLFTRNVANMQTAASVACQNWDESERNGRPTLGVAAGSYLAQATADTRNEFEMQVARLEDAGYEVKQTTPFEDIQAVNRHQKNVVSGEVALEFESFVENYEEELRETTANRFREGYDVTAKEIAAARRHQWNLRAHLEDEMNRRGIDLWLSPGAPGPAPKGIDDTGNPVMNEPWTHAGLPVLTVPAGSVNDLPIGLQVTASFGDDEALLLWGNAIESRLC